MDDAITEALRNETALPNARLEALRDFTLSVVRGRGEVDESEVQAFIDAGFTQRQILEVVLGVAQKVMSNYTNHLTRTPVDAPFQPFAWNKATAVGLTPVNGWPTGLASRAAVWSFAALGQPGTRVSSRLSDLAFGAGSPRWPSAAWP